MKSIISILFLVMTVFSFDVSAEGTWSRFVDGNHIEDMAAQGNYLWCATGGGLVKWNLNDMSYMIYNSDNGAPFVKASRVEVDSNGIVWVWGNNGLSRYDDSGWMHFPFSNNISVLSMAIRENGVLLLGGYSGLYSFNGSRLECISTGTPLQGLGFPAVVTGPNNEIWAATSAGAAHFDGTKWISFRQDEGYPVPTYDVESVAIASDGAVWFVQKDLKIIRYHDGSWRTFSKSDGVDGAISLSAAPDASIWAACGKNGLAKYDGVKWPRFVVPISPETGYTTLVFYYGALWFDRHVEKVGLGCYKNDQWDMYRTESGPAYWYNLKGIVLDNNKTSTF